MEKLGLLSMGETPRTDILPVMQREMPGVELVEYGILDGLDEAARRDLAPLPGDFPLVSRLRDGSQCSMGKKQAAKLLEKGLLALHAQGIRIVVLLCTCRCRETKSAIYSSFLSGCSSISAASVLPSMYSKESAHLPSTVPTSRIFGMVSPVSSILAWFSASFRISALE